jgi:hypothetical protein
MKTLKLLLLLFLVSNLQAQNLASAFVEGDFSFDQAGQFNGKNGFSQSHPEALASHCMWSTDTAIYLFGGSTKDPSQGNALVLSNRLWKYTTSAGWELIKGSTGTVRVTTTSSTPVYNGVSDLLYGSPGVSSAANFPGARAGAAYTSDGNGGFFMYGGYGLGYNGSGKAVGTLEDLWHFDGSNWTCLMDYLSIGRSPVYGTKGQADPANTPGSRAASALWYKDGFLYLFGGAHTVFTSDATIGPNLFSLANMTGKNDLWRFDLSTHQWTWVDGATTAHNLATQNGATYTHPPSTAGASYCIGANGDFYLYGGYEYWFNSSGSDFYSPSETLWKYNVTSGWTLLGGVPNAINSPTMSPGIQAWAPLIEFNGSLYIFPGIYSYNGIQNQSTIQSSIFKWDGSNWQTVKACANEVEPGLAFQNDACLGNAGSGAVVLFKDEIFHYGGVGDRNPIKYSARLSRFNGQNFATVSSLPNNTTSYFDSQTMTASLPGSLYQAATAFDDSTRTLYVYGGDNSENGLFANLWQYKDGQWTWLFGPGSSSTTRAVYGTQGVASSSVTPGARMSAGMWCANGYLWLFGGRGYDTNGSLGRMSDLFRYDLTTGQWTWIKGPKTISGAGSFGTKGQANSTNNPPGISGMKVWKPSSSGNTTYLYGGIANGTNNYHDAVWKFDGANWTWVAGSSSPKAVPVFGTTGSFSASNTPGARLNFALAQAPDGFYVYGGEVCMLRSGASTPVYNNHLWFFDVNLEQWKFLKGSISAVQNTPSYAVSSLNGSSVNPGFVRGASAWFSNGHLYVFGGQVYNGSGLFVSNNLWEWDGSNWAWLSGGQTIPAIQQTSVYSETKHFNFNNSPYPRYYSLAWKDGEVFYLAKGASTSSTSTIVAMDDIWAFETGNIWNGTAWSKGLPNSKTENAQIVSSTAVANDIQINSLLVDADEALNMGTNTLKIAGDLNNYGSLNSTGEIHFNGSGTQSLYGNDLQISDFLIVESGSVLQGNGKIKTNASGASSYGQIVNWGEILGEVEFAYYMPLASGVNNAQYLHIGSIFSGATLSLITSSASGIAQTGNGNAAQNTIWKWDAGTAEWQSPAGSQAFSPGTGYSVYAGNSSYGNFLLASGQAESFKMKGNLENSNSLNVSLNYNDGTNSSALFVNNVPGAIEGWNFVANPFSHSISVESLLDGLDFRSIYVWDGKNNRYASVNVSDPNNISYTNGGSLFIPPGQGFFFQYSEQDWMNSSVLTFNRSQLYANQSPIYLKSAGNSSEGIRLQIRHRDSISVSDDAWLGFRDQASSLFDQKYDAWKIRSHDKELIYIYTKGQEHSISNFDSDSITYVDLGIVAKHGDSLNFQVILKDLRTFNEIGLEDLKLSTDQDLVKNSSYAFVHDTAIEHRLRLHFGRRNLSIKDYQATNPGFSFYNQNARIFLSHLNPESKAARKVKIFNLSGLLVETKDWDTTIEDLEILVNQAAGFYLVQLEEPISKNVETLKVIKTGGQ